MELKDYQANVVGAVNRYLDELATEETHAQKILALREENPELNIPLPDPTEATWDRLAECGLLPRSRSEIPFCPRQDGSGQPVPSICLKVPTAGGKTLLAAHAVSAIMAKRVQKNTGFVLWIVPNEAIYNQTLRALKNREHPYRQVLDKASAGRVLILEKEDRLHRRDVEANLCIMPLMLQSANRETRESLRMFRDRGNVHGFFPSEDNLLANAQLLKTVPNLDVYGDSANIGAITKDSLGNALRVIRPVVVLDEGHRGYSELAMRTLYGFNPTFVLELTATPVDKPRANPPRFSNWLVDVRGTDLHREEMIKLPLNVTVRSGDSWKDCLRDSFERLDRLQAEAEKLRGETSRYVRPICLVQVERTGSDQRDGSHIHAEDVREALLRLGAAEDEVALKTAATNELADPESPDLLSPRSRIRFIVTKQALQEGWDCPFAYVLCSLAPTSSRSALTQLVGRILRQPDATRTGITTLDECYVFCHHTTTREVIEVIKSGLEGEGMGDVIGAVREVGGKECPTGMRAIDRRERSKGLEVFLPEVLWVEGEEVRPIDYDTDILQGIDWSEISIDGIGEQVPRKGHSAGTQFVRIDLSEVPEAEGLIHADSLGEAPHATEFDYVFATRSITDVIPNPWVARALVGSMVDALRGQGFSDQEIGETSSISIQVLRGKLIEERDRLAEGLFMKDVEAGRIQFRLRADGQNWRMPHKQLTTLPPDAPRLIRPDGEPASKSLFAPAYKDELNLYEQKVACYLDGRAALKWWHRNVAKAYGSFSIQGWRRTRMYPDFIFSLSEYGAPAEIVILESKGDFLDNADTAYKNRLLKLCSSAYEFDTTPPKGELELVLDEHNSVRCVLVFESNWEARLGEIVG